MTLDTYLETQEMPKARRPAKRIRRTTDKLAEALATGRRRIASIESRPKYSAEYKAERVAAIREETAAQVAEIEAAAGKQLAKAEKQCEPAPPPTDPGKAVLLENQKARAWQRIKPLLDRDRDPLEVATRLATQGDRLAFQALVEELPSYLDAQIPDGEKPTGNDRRIERIMGGVHDIGERLWTPEEREAHEGLREAKVAHASLQTNLGYIKRELGGGEQVFELYGEDDDGALETYDFS